jgi:ERCC4-related helicase
MEYAIEKVDKPVIMKHGYISIPDYDFNDCMALQNYLSEFNEVTFTRDYYGLFYDEKKRELRVPVGVGMNTVVKMTGREAKFDFNTYDTRYCKIKLLYKPRNELQEKIITDIIEKNRKYSQHCIIAGTGIGKTYCAIATSSFFQNATFVVTHSSKLRSYWVDRFEHFTSLEKDEIISIEGTKQLVKLMENDNYKKYSVFVTTHQTLQSLAKSLGWDYVTDMFKIFGIGTTIIDEIHRQFSNTVKILTHTNTKKYLLMTATFKQSPRRRDKIFQSCFRSVPKFIQANVTEEKVQGHINGYLIRFNSRPSIPEQLKCEVRKLLHPAYYANYLIDKDPDFLNVFDFYVENCIMRNKTFKGKGLVFCGSIHACEELSKHVAEEFSYLNINVGLYHSKLGLTQKEKDELLNESDIVFTTSHSLSEGVDVKDLHYVIDVEAYRSDILSEQIPGRLRDLDDGHKFVFIKISNIGFMRVRSQLENCIKNWNKNFGSFEIREWEN